MVRLQRRKLLASCLCMTATVFLLATLQVVVELGKFERKKFKNSHLQDGHNTVEEGSNRLNVFLKKEALTLNGKKKLEVGDHPIMLWWSPLTGETGRLGQCGADACFFTINRTYLHHPMTKAFLFYGLATQKMEGRRDPPELPSAHHVCLLNGFSLPSLPSGTSWEFFAGDVDRKLPAIQKGSPGAKCD
ncbi:alpha-(1,3)-fucosyltransferase 10 isoform X4 [Octodon degus]|uniref:Alpha-(1,3)-fucosyltransferase 10 isoform X4 n=1 Tax=Octodon degus TaxID=10160 RepID=A0A6P6F023_OCTDE|nr:alpha-(1,3)-fucosyltransferase 10 isoform X4 [Octodon degus]